MLTLYTAHTPNGHKAAIALHELALPHTVRSVDLAAGEQHRAAFLALNPNNKIPVLVDDDQTIFESGAILIHLADKTGRLLPAEPAARSVALQWLFLQVGSIGPMLGQLWWFRHGSPTPNPAALERYQRETLRLYGVIERRLETAAYLAGDDYSIADIASYPWLATHEELGIPIADYPRLRDWLALIGQRPAVQRGMQAPRDGANR
ncbi:glutathione S-transferase N-terminal domain-containing protein [Neisseriaceae bacterium JH1-16]|nr:glutathione S-transferase N-terminal domain-containing protein [Neisseriaceae bacterium JH1-16]